MTNISTSNKKELTFAQNDIFEQKPFAEQLLKIINSMPDERVILLNAPWGEGKTAFAKMFQNHLNQDKKHWTIYYDVFAHDYYAQPLLPFVEKIYHLIGNGKGKEKEKLKIKKILRAITKDALNATTAGILSNTINQLFKENKENKNDIDELKEYLGNIADKDKPIIFIIDELDRCKPTYAIEILEIIKHLFSVRNIVFLLIANSEELCKSIKHQYGNEINAQKYLHKFIHFQVELPKQNKTTISDNEIYIKYYMKELKFNQQIISLDIKLLQTIFTEHANHYKLSLREIERYLLTIKIVLILLSARARNIEDFVIIPFMVIIKNNFPDTYTRLSNKDLTYERLLIELNTSDYIIQNTSNGTILEKLLQTHLDNRSKNQISDVDKIIKTLNNLSLS